VFVPTKGFSVPEETQYRLEPLREGAEFTLWRGAERADPTPILALSVAGSPPSAQSLKRLEHEYALASELDPAWAARPLALTRHQGREVLILSDPGGEPLDQVIERARGRPLNVTRFLEIAIGLAAALGQVHRRGLIHKDVKPANALVDEAGRVWLTGFGIASRLPSERLAPAPAETIAGTLAYMSPEQTGRMNRSVDARSDLYSLGVTLYEMLTGALPFTAADPLGWVHCHIARQPVPPSDRRPVPAPVSAIVMGLLAKNAEERYQTAAGLEADLRRCLTAWQAQGRIEAFPLGADDLSDRLLIPEKLYGREHDVAALLAAFDRVASRGGVELVLVSGYSGVGKSSVVNELHKALVPPRGLFAAGKFDQYQRDVPYATLAQAFQTLVRQILAKSERELDDWRMALGEALGANGRLITDLIPELELVIGPQPLVAELPPQDAQRRFQAVLRRFIGVFARPEHPLALFLDDLQWLDAATLDLMEDLLTEGGVRHLLLVGAYRDNEVGAEHPLTRRLDAIRRSGAAVQHIVLAPLSDRDLGQLIGETLHTEAAASLVRIVHEKTGGNPFFAIQFLHTLADEGLLAFDHAQARWSWDVDRIHAKRYTDNVVDLMVAKLDRLPAHTVAALRQLACVGASAEFALLTTVCQVSLEALHERLWEAVRAGLVVRSEFAYAFQHDRIQEAAYSLIPEGERAEAHLRIGRLLREHTPPDKGEDIVFEMVGHFNRSAALITAPGEREAVARLNLVAGKRARNAAAYASALAYFNAARNLLTDDCWTWQYALAFALGLSSAECEFLTGELVSADERLSTLTGRATNIIDRAAITCLHMDVCSVLPDLERAVDLCRLYLRDVGIRWPDRPDDKDVRRGCEAIQRRIGSRDIEDLLDLPPMVDPGVRATMDVLCRAMSSAEATDDKLVCLLVAEMVRLSLDHGNSGASCCGYTWFGAVLGAILEDYAASFRFGQLGLALVDRQGFDAFKGRVYFGFGLSVSPWSQHLKISRRFLLKAADEANKVGDLPYLEYSRIHRVANSLALGLPLSDVEKEISDAIEYARRDSIFPFMTLAHLCLARSLQGSPFEFIADDGETFDEESFRQRMEADPNQKTATHLYWSGKLQASVFAGDYLSANRAAAKADDLRWIAPADFEQADYHFYAALARAGSADSSGAARPDDHACLEAMAAHHAQLQTWAEHCPENFENRAALIGSEIARLEGRDVEAQRLYQLAISSARANGFVHNEALACETAARFYAAGGFDDIAEMYLLRARDGYARWGADGVVRRLEARYPRLAGSDPRGKTDAAAPADQPIDVAAVVKASQALSSEMLLPRLVERLMTITLQNAGAERGLLILIRDGEPRIEAEAVTETGEIKLAVRQAAVTPSDLPQSVLHYALRTQERVLLDDASSSDAYAADAYVRGKRSRSILCLPIVRQGELVGALYLENGLAPGVFTPERVTVLELLASQAAISLENAALYADLQVQVGVLQQLPVSAWTLRPDGTPDFVNQVWLEFADQTLDFVRSNPEAWMTAIHPEDRETAAMRFWEGVRSGESFSIETRSLRARDGTYRWHLQQAAVLRDADGNVLKFVGTTTDIDDHKRTEETLRQAQSDLAHVARVATLNAMTASIAHEVSQPLSGILTNANTSLRMLDADPPDLTGAAETARRTIRDANRATAVIRRLRAMFSTKAPAMERVDLNEAAREVIALSAGELRAGRALVQTNFAEGVPLVRADRVQLQQVILNLLLNAADAMADIEDRPRSLLVRTMQGDDGGVGLAVRDAGVGVDPGVAGKLFQSFYTTKADGMGVGLSICRAIIESHDGRLWWEANDGPGATFSFWIPAAR
jgi:PAS domain S-box-containing protein